MLGYEIKCLSVAGWLAPDPTGRVLLCFQEVGLGFVETAACAH